MIKPKNIAKISKLTEYNIPESQTTFFRLEDVMKHIKNSEQT